MTDRDCEIMNRDRGSYAVSDCDAVPFVRWRYCIVYNLPFYLISVSFFSNYIRSGYT